MQTKYNTPLLRAIQKKGLVAVQWCKRPLIQRLVIVILSTLVALCIGGTLFVPWHEAYAAQTCWSNPTLSACNQQDPIKQGCTTDAQTLLMVPITRQKQQVGLLELRHSHHCNTYWARCTSLSQGFANLSLLTPFKEEVAGPFRGPTQSEYTDMVFGETPPIVTGSINFSDQDRPQETLS